MAGEVYFDAIVAAVSRLFGLGSSDSLRWEYDCWSSGHQPCTQKLWGKIRKVSKWRSHLELFQALGFSPFLTLNRSLDYYNPVYLPSGNHCHGNGKLNICRWFYHIINYKTLFSIYCFGTFPFSHYDFPIIKPIFPCRFFFWPWDVYICKKWRHVRHVMQKRAMDNYITGWCFGTSILFSHLLGC